LPYRFDKELSDKEIDEIIKYNENDLDITLELYLKLKPNIELRETLNKLHNIDTFQNWKDYRNMGDAKLGLELMSRDVKIKPNKITPKYRFKLDLPKYLDNVKTPILKELVNKLREHEFRLNDKMSVIVPKWLKRTINVAGVDFDIGIGGLHSKEKSLTVRGRLRNIDVTSYYPSLIMEHSFTPDNVDSEQYVKYARKTFNERVEAKKTEKRLKNLARDRDLSKEELEIFDNAKLINATNKLILNGALFGKMGDKFSPIFSPRGMVNVTVTGQLSLLYLIEQLSEIKGVKIISSNTDGIEILDSQNQLEQIEFIVDCWELETGLKMEFGQYKALHASSVNHYIAIYNGYTKEKGIYAPPSLGKKVSNVIVYKALREYFLNKTPIKETIYASKNIMDFVTVQKVKYGAKLVTSSKLNNPKISKDEINSLPFKNVGSTIRYYYAKDSNSTLFYMGDKNGDRVSNANNIELLQNLNNFKGWETVDYARYIQLAYKELENLGVNTNEIK
jgi:hypothetical protein